MLHKNHTALGFLLIALGAAGRALMGVPGDTSGAELTLTLLAALGVVLLGSRFRLALVPALGQIALELVLCGTQSTGIWVWLRPALRLADLWLLLWLVGQVLAGGRQLTAVASFAPASRRMFAAAAGVLAVQTVLLLWSAAQPENLLLARVNAGVFVLFSVLLLWFTILVIRLYNEARAREM